MLGLTRRGGCPRQILRLAARQLRHTVPLATPSRNLVVAVDDTMLSWQAVRYTLDELYRKGEAAYFPHGCISACMQRVAWRIHPGTDGHA